MVNHPSIKILMPMINFFVALCCVLKCRPKSIVFCVLCLSALSNGSFGMQLGNLLSVFHIMWHVYDPNKFKMSISSQIYRCNNFSIYLRSAPTSEAFNVRACVWQCLQKMTISQVELWGRRFEWAWDAKSKKKSA